VIGAIITTQALINYEDEESNILLILLWPLFLVILLLFKLHLLFKRWIKQQ